MRLLSSTLHAWPTLNADTTTIAKMTTTVTVTMTTTTRTKKTTIVLAHYALKSESHNDGNTFSISETISA